ncbi:MAG: ribosome maturation factor RimM [Bacteroidota bacterium]
MKNQQEYIAIGRVRKAHGITGEVKVSIEDRYLEDFLKNERIFIEMKSSRMPYFISSVRGESEMIVKLEEVDDRDAAIALHSKEIFLRKEDLIPDDEREFEPEEEDSIQYRFLNGYSVTDKTTGPAGVITEVVEMPQQEMAFVLHHGREVLIPLNESLIISIDRENKTLLMDLPEGLLDM